jgi:hypothetical protein
VSVVTDEYGGSRRTIPGVPDHLRRRAAALSALGLLAVALLLAGCGGGSGGTSSSSSSPAGASSPEPAPAQAQASAEAAADPARASDAKTAALAVALRATDLPPGWSVQANPVPDGALSGNPSLSGICGGSFPSEAHRIAKYPVVGLDPAGTPSVLSEAIAYDSAASASAGLGELGDAFATCTAKDRTVVTAPRVDGLAPAAVVVEYDLAGGTRQEVIAQARGSVLSVLIGEDESATAMAARSIATRLAALPAGAIGG